MCFAAAGVAALAVVTPVWLGVGVMLALWLIGGVLSERIFRRIATPEEVRADLEERVRNPPD